MVAYPHTNFNVVLIEPEIPNNTGNIGRTCVGNFCQLHLVGRLGFEITDKQLKRAGLDYWQHLSWYHHKTFQDWYEKVPDPSRVFFFSKKASKSFYQVTFQKGDWLVFGKETKGLNSEILSHYSSQLLQIPFTGPIRSLNLATAVAIVTYEGLRQTCFTSAKN
ncbi:MAG: tRNA (cytidine(34)-2'-O)-methyltransferase [Bdellovibrionales bacterium]|nr:tRNA (cytidine(34)-2'-O)-methyltransferase [Bdellovibrionales bacterium]